MSKIPEPRITIQGLIDQHHEQNQEPPRAHFGLSQVGHHCDRYLWAMHRWIVKPDFPGRVLRIFRRGHHEEYTVVEDLKAIGLKLENVLDDQRRVIVSELVSGSLDGVIKYGVPEAPKTEHLLEVKTMNSKRFNELTKKGLQASNPVYYAQVQAYMRLAQLNRALHLTVCKDDDRIYTERVRLDRAYADELIERAKRLSTAERIPDPVSTDPTWYQCKMCSCWGFCHSQRLTREVTCRSCAHSTPDPKRGWVCERWGSEVIPTDAQRVGCDSHVLHPDMVPWEPAGAVGDWTGKYIIDGQEVANGEDGYKTREIFAILDGGGVFNDRNVDAVREVFGGDIVK